VKTLLQLAAAFALFSLGVGAAVLSVGGYKIEKQALAALEHADAVLAQAQGEWQDDKARIHSILDDAADGAKAASLFAQEQRVQLRKTSRDSDNQVRALGLVTRNAEKFFYNLDQQVNGKILPDFDRELVSTSTAAQFGFESLTKTADDLDFQIQDPEIQQTLHGLNLATNNFASASANASSILAHGDHVAGYYDKKLTTPIGFWKTLLYSTLDIGAKAGSISAGFVK
jgi:hypothetical protein